MEAIVKYLVGMGIPADTALATASRLMGPQIKAQQAQQAQQTQQAQQPAPTYGGPNPYNPLMASYAHTAFQSGASSRGTAPAVGLQFQAPQNQMMVPVASPPSVSPRDAAPGYHRNQGLRHAAFQAGLGAPGGNALVFNPNFDYLRQ